MALRPAVRNSLVIGGIVAMIGTHFYMNIFQPVMNPEMYNQMREQTQAYYEGRRKT
ncbi:uncharacterized protein LOC116424435 [Nomia melanderi]|uniref:uncharacterized protein LOC116424435 n=1 Tax=Nomia melanderi TaxID=2448451 RepID=UPI003FCC4FA1